MTDGSARLRVHPSAMHRALQGEGVLLQLDHGEYFGLDEVGERAWELLVEHGNLARVTEIMLEEFDVEADVLTADLGRLVDELIARQLLERVQSEAAGDERTQA